MALLALIPTGPPEQLIPSELVGERGMDRPSMYGLELGGGDFMGMFGPGVSLAPAPLTKARLVGVESVNGVRALHYRGETAPNPLMGGGPDTRMSADVWLAADGLYLVRSETRSSGGLAPSQTRTDVSDANKPITVKPPSR